MSRRFLFKPFTREYCDIVQDARHSETAGAPAAPCAAPEEGAGLAPWLLTPSAIAAGFGRGERRHVH